MKKAIGLFLVGSALIVPPAFADDCLKLAKEKQCMTCHEVDKDKVGPSFQSIAKKYNSDKDPGFRLVKKIMGGSSSTIHHGMKMPPAGDAGSSRSPNARPALTFDEAADLTSCVLSQQPK